MSNHNELPDIVNYLTDGYWQHFGEQRRKFDVEPGGTLTVNINGLTPQGQQLATWALEAWTMVSGIHFRQVSHANADIVFDDNQAGAFTRYTLSRATGHIDTAHINVSVNWLYESGTTIDSYTFQTYLHEIGHALGLGHAGPYDERLHPIFMDTIAMNDTMLTTVMSYIDQEINPAFPGSNVPVVTPMIFDIMAIHELYGEPDGANTGDTRYGYRPNSGTYMDTYFNEGTTIVAGTLYDTGGIDWLDLRTDFYDQHINLNPGFLSSVGGALNNLIIGPDTIIENAFGGSGDDTILGNAADNRLYGGAGDDILIGYGGRDKLYGFSGFDFIKGDTGNDYIRGGQGGDLLVGGSGNDVFVFGPQDGNFEDVIVDFNKGRDRLDLKRFPTLHSLDDLDYYASPNGVDNYLDLTAHGGGIIILADFTDPLYPADVVFSDPLMA